MLDHTAMIFSFCLSYPLYIFTFHTPVLDRTAMTCRPHFCCNLHLFRRSHGWTEHFLLRDKQIKTWFYFSDCFHNIPFLLQAKLSPSCPYPSLQTHIPVSFWSSWEQTRLAPKQSSWFMHDTKPDTIACIRHIYAFLSLPLRVSADKVRDGSTNNRQNIARRDGGQGTMAERDGGYLKTKFLLIQVIPLYCLEIAPPRVKRWMLPC